MIRRPEVMHVHLTHAAVVCGEDYSVLVSDHIMTNWGIEGEHAGVGGFIFIPWTSVAFITDAVEESERDDD